MSGLATATAKLVLRRRMSIPGLRTGRLYTAVRDGQSEGITSCCGCDVDYLILLSSHLEYSGYELIGEAVGRAIGWPMALPRTPARSDGRAIA